MFKRGCEQVGKLHHYAGRAIFIVKDKYNLPLTINPQGMRMIYFGNH